MRLSQTIWALALAGALACGGAAFAQSGKPSGSGNDDQTGGEKPRMDGGGGDNKQGNNDRSGNSDRSGNKQGNDNRKGEKPRYGQ